MKQKQSAKVLSQREIAPQIFDMWLATEVSLDAKPGQFIGIYPKDKSTLLPRPISICQVDKGKKALRVVYRAAGQGTREFSSLCAGDFIDVLGVLGNGYPLERAVGKRVFLMGGGIGIPPLVELAHALRKQGMDAENLMILAGYRDSNLFLQEELSEYGTVFIATEDGSAGTKGNILDAVREHHLEADVVFACGPMPMLKAIKQYGEAKGVEAYLSLEERMACGVGACLGCVVKTKEVHHHSHVHNARICTDGPVFAASEVDI